MEEIAYDIRSKIHSIRGMQVMLDRDLAELYGVATKRLNEQVSRNIGRFPEHFMFRLTEEECHIILRSHFATSNSVRGGRRYLPYAFTEQGVAMLSGVLKSETAVRISIQIIDTFVEMRRFIASNAQVFQRLDVVEKKQIEYGDKIEQLFGAIEERNIKPQKGIFFDADIIRSADKSIVIIESFS